MSLLGVLEDGRKDFHEAAAGISAEQSSLRPNSGGWSVLECVEHVVTVEERYLSWLSEGKPAETARDTEKETRLFTIIRSRLRRVETPAALRPRGRFGTFPEALAAFESVRQGSLGLVAERGATLYSIGARHPYFGELNGVEWIQLIDGHARRHADQIREIAESLAARVR